MSQCGIECGTVKVLETTVYRGCGTVAQFPRIHTSYL